MFAGLITVAALIALPGAAPQQTVTCSAVARRAQTCVADTSNGVLLVHEESPHLCQLGKTWRYDSRGIHVSGGCSADFLVNPKHSNAFGEGGYRTYGTGVDAFHTNGHVGPGSSAIDGNDSTPAQSNPRSTPQAVPKPQPLAEPK